MVKRHSAVFHRLVGIIGASRNARRTHRRLPVVVLEPGSVAEAP